MAKKITQAEIEDIIKLFTIGYSSREIAQKVLGKSTRKSTVNDLLARLGLREKVVVENKPISFEEDYRKAKILFFDLETSPIKSAVWSLWNNNVGLNQIFNDWYLLSYCAIWADSSTPMYKDKRDSAHTEDDKELLKDLWKLLDEADFVIGHNIRKFDVKKLNARFILNGFTKPSTFRMIDTLEIAKESFAFTSNKLEYLTDKLCNQHKKSTHGKFAGFSLWSECLKGNQEAWQEMEDYNIMDVLSNRELYEVLSPWSNKLPNLDVYTESEDLSGEWAEDGYHYTNLGKYTRYRNTRTGQQRRGRVNLLSKEKRASLLANIVS